jgi:serine phosphatase RsbU (regulator of sigma subunit)
MPPPLHATAAVAKIGKYASRESGDTVEVVERPRGGFSIVLADGQRSGLSAKVISNLVVQKALSLLAEGVRDGAVARATHDYLHMVRDGKVSAELTLVSVDMKTQTLVVSRNSRCPSLLRVGSNFSWLNQSSEAIGIYSNTKPSIAEFALRDDLTLVAFTDGVWAAGTRTSEKLDLPDVVRRLDPDGSATAQTIADGVLDAALALDQARPHDDATVVAVKVMPLLSTSGIRRMMVDFPLVSGG